MRVEVSLTVEHGTCTHTHTHTLNFIAHPFNTSGRESPKLESIASKCKRLAWIGLDR